MIFIQFSENFKINKKIPFNLVASLLKFEYLYLILIYDIFLWMIYSLFLIIPLMIV